MKSSYNTLVGGVVSQAAKIAEENKQLTANDVLKAAEAGGVKNSLNAEDIKLINSNPSVGMEMVNYKIDYVNAPEGEAGDYTRGIARAGTEYLRQKYGGYSTNADGSQVIYNPSAGTPTGSGVLSPNYSSKKTSNNSDLYKNYEKAILDAQAKAQENVYGMVAAGTAGNASSSAMTKAAAAGADFSQLLAEKKAEFENQQYNRNLNEAQVAASMGDFSKLRAMGIDTTIYEKKIKAQEDATARQTALNEALTAMEIGDYSKLAALGFDTSYLEKIQNDEAAQSELTNAINLAKIGIYEPLEAIGYDATWLRGQQGDASTPKLDLNTALALKEAGYSSPDIEAAISYWLGEGYTYTAPAAPVKAGSDGTGSSLTLSQALSEAKAGRLSEAGKKVVDAVYGDGYYEKNFGDVYKSQWSDTEWETAARSQEAYALEQTLARDGNDAAYTKLLKWVTEGDMSAEQANLLAAVAGIMAPEE